MINLRPGVKRSLHDFLKRCAVPVHHDHLVPVHDQDSDHSCKHLINQDIRGACP